MKATLKLFATLAAFLPAEARREHRTEVDLAEGASALDLIERFRVPPAQCAMVLLNGVFVARADLAATVLREGDVLAIWPPVGGG